MDSAQFNETVTDLANIGWNFRNLLLKKGNMTPEIVNFEELLHTLEQYLTELNEESEHLSQKPL